ncbi:hypothetical protein L9F63_000257 [Diploptera punctata]|uniref:Zinc finger PHD-type domain-containing protein n=1 Tax=Diploptera punctata TaxID=6984 RepID=A0AAD8ESI9_DIPPU|nr:hypothetical protein L9F63_000257 [Diploptera punctata]
MKGIGCKKQLFKKSNSVKSKTSRPRKRQLSSSSEKTDTERELIYSEFGADDADAECLFCTGLYSEDTRGEKWAQCINCHRWAHEDCGAHEEPFVCPICSKKQN